MLGLLLAPAPLFAQAPPAEGAADARLHLGPLALDPRVSIRNLGVDTNVFNEASGATRDTTATVGPALDSWLRVGRVNLSAASSLGWNYFQRSTTQRSLDASQAGRVSLDLLWLQPHATGMYERTRQRPNLEIDTRVRHRTTTIGAGAIVGAGHRLSVDFDHERRHIDFGDASFGNQALAQVLNRNETDTSATLHYVLTPLTTFSVRTAYERDRFTFTPTRDTDSLRVMPGLTFKPLALIAGSASVGFRRFTPRHDVLPAYRGLVADVQLSYLLRDLMRVAVGVTRDLDYSFEVEEPYYVSTGVTLSITQALGARWDVVARGGRTTLDYRAARIANGQAADGHRDRIAVYGIGIGRHVGSDARLGIDVDHATRQSGVSGRAYQGLRVGGEVTYGF